MSDTHQVYLEAERLKEEGKHHQAIDKLKEILDVEPGHILSHLALAVGYGRIGQHEEAVQHAERACQLEPHEAFNFTALSVTYQRAWAGTQERDYITKAEAAMARAHELQGTNPRH